MLFNPNTTLKMSLFLKQYIKALEMGQKAIAILDIIARTLLTGCSRRTMIDTANLGEYPTIAAIKMRAIVIEPLIRAILATCVDRSEGE